MKILAAELPTKQAAELAAKITGEGKKPCTIWHWNGNGFQTTFEGERSSERTRCRLIEPKI